MRLWTIHPKYLDAKGLVAAWREGLLAQKVLAGGAKGYAHHPQLERFKAAPDPRGSIALYLEDLRAEAERRGYGFDAARIGAGGQPPSADGTGRPPGPEGRGGIPVGRGQIEYEFELLKLKLEARDAGRRAALEGIGEIELNAAFERGAGGVAPWEKARAEVLERLGARGL